MLGRHDRQGVLGRWTVDQDILKLGVVLRSQPDIGVDLKGSLLEERHDAARGAKLGGAIGAASEPAIEGYLILLSASVRACQEPHDGPWEPFDRNDPAAQRERLPVGRGVYRSSGMAK
jgi:hypothetical protein